MYINPESDLGRYLKSSENSLSAPPSSASSSKDSVCQDDCYEEHKVLKKMVMNEHLSSRSPNSPSAHQIFSSDDGVTESKIRSTFQSGKLFVLNQVKAVISSWAQPELEAGVLLVQRELQILQALIQCNGSVAERRKNESKVPGYAKAHDNFPWLLGWGLLPLLIVMVLTTLWEASFAMIASIALAVMWVGASTLVKHMTRQSWAKLHKDVQLLTKRILAFRNAANKCWRLVRNAQGVSYGLRCSFPPPPVTRVEANRSANQPTSSPLALEGVRNVMEKALRRVLSKTTHASFAFSNGPIRRTSLCRREVPIPQDSLLLHELWDLTTECLESVEEIAVLLSEELQNMNQCPTQFKFISCFEDFEAPIIVENLSTELETQTAVLSCILGSDEHISDMMISAKEVLGERFTQSLVKCVNLQARYEEAVTKIFLWRNQLIACAATLNSQSDEGERKRLLQFYVDGFEQLKVEELEEFPSSVSEGWLEVQASLEDLLKVFSESIPNTAVVDPEEEISKCSEMQDSKTYGSSTQDNKDPEHHISVLQSSKSIFQEAGEVVHPLEPASEISVPFCTEIFTAVGGADDNEADADLTGNDSAHSLDQRIEGKRRQVMLEELLVLLNTKEKDLAPEMNVTEMGCNCYTSEEGLQACVIHSSGALKNDLNHSYETDDSTLEKRRDEKYLKPKSLKFQLINSANSGNPSSLLMELNKAVISKNITMTADHVEETFLHDSSAPSSSNSSLSSDCEMIT